MSDNPAEANSSNIAEEKQTPERSIPADLLREAAFVPPREPSSEEHARIGETIHRYRITGLLGRGGMGVVYSALDLELKRKVALKLLPASAVESKEQRRGLLREARTGAAASHPNIAAVFDVGEADGVVFIAMECIEGRSLRAVMEAGRTALPAAEAFRIALEIARGVAAAHEVGVTHRDIKPENVMVSDAGVVKLVDFGLARAFGASASDSTGVTTHEGGILGTPSYMSPEQVRGDPASARSDVFALGIVLYEMLARARPFRGVTVADVLASVLRDEPPPLSSVRKGVALPLARIVSRCLEKDPRKRYAHAGELLAALEDAAPAVMSVLPQPSRRRWLFGLAWLWLAGPAIAGAIVAMGPSTPVPPDSIRPPPEVPTPTAVLPDPREPPPVESQSPPKPPVPRPVPRPPPPEPELLPRVAPFRIPVEGSVTELALADTSLALTSRGDILVWDRPPVSTSNWFKLAPIPEVVSIAASRSLLLAADRSGKVWVWTREDPGPVRLDNTSGVRSVALTRGGVVLLLKSGAVSMFVWTHAAKQHEITVEWLAKAAIVTVPGMDRMKAISSREDSWLALREDGTVWCGMSTSRKSNPRDMLQGSQQVLGLSGVVTIAGDSNNSLALDHDGAVWAWEYDTYSSLIKLGKSPQSAAKVPGLPRIKAIATGTNSSLALDYTGRVWEWAMSYQGRQMTSAGTRILRGATVPRLVEGLPPARLIASSEDSSYAVSAADGELWAWGARVVQ